jgi:lipopolysaccharide/colanic/teichoic acid biosynthesis glycosyltransferase
MNSSKNCATGSFPTVWHSAAALVSDTAGLAPAQGAQHQHLCPVKMEVWKRLLDLALIIVCLPPVLLLMALIASMIKLVSPGPILFRQERIGYRRRRFMCLKFRTMKPGADIGAHQQHLDHLLKSNAPMTKLDRLGDARLIPGARLLRATGLDELPQIFNVLRGEMSLVGPRPCTPYELANFKPEHLARFDALPGLTGLWQVSGKNRTTFSQMLEWDIQYAGDKSLWLDLRILARTLPAVVAQIRSR